MGLREGGREGKECRVQAVPTQKRIWNTAVINQQFSYIFCLVKLEKKFSFDQYQDFKNQERSYKTLDFNCLLTFDFIGLLVIAFRVEAKVIVIVPLSF